MLNTFILVIHAINGPLRRAKVDQRISFWSGGHFQQVVRTPYVSVTVRPSDVPLLPTGRVTKGCIVLRMMNVVSQVPGPRSQVPGPRSQVPGLRSQVSVPVPVPVPT
jgi:hypothetical protein